MADSETGTLAQEANKLAKTIFGKVVKNQDRVTEFIQGTLNAYKKLSDSIEVYLKKAAKASKELAKQGGRRAGAVAGSAILKAKELKGSIKEKGLLNTLKDAKDKGLGYAAEKVKTLNGAINAPPGEETDTTGKRKGLFSRLSDRMSNRKAEIEEEKTKSAEKGKEGTEETSGGGGGLMGLIGTIASFIPGPGKLLGMGAKALAGGKAASAVSKTAKAAKAVSSEETDTTGKRKGLFSRLSDRMSNRKKEIEEEKEKSKEGLKKKGEGGGWMGTVLTILGGIATSLYAGFKFITGGGIRKLLGKAVKGLGKALWWGLKGVGKLLWSGITAIAPKVGSLIKGVAKGMWSVVKNLGSIVGTLGKALGGLALKVAKGVGGAIWWLGSKLLGGLGSIFSSIKNVGGNLLKGVAGLLGGIVTPIYNGITNIGNSVLTGIRSIGTFILDGITSLAGKIVSGIGSALGGLGKLLGFGGGKGAEAGAKAAGKEGAELAAKQGGKTAAKAVGKSLLKKIPVIGAIAGLGFAVSRAMDGDWTGAGLEMASGLASTIPGAGTAASVGIDGALAYRDFKRATDGEGQSEESKAAEAEVQTKAKEAMDDVSKNQGVPNKGSQAPKQPSIPTMQGPPASNKTSGSQNVAAKVAEYDVSGQSSEGVKSNFNIATGTVTPVTAIDLVRVTKLASYTEEDDNKSGLFTKARGEAYGYKITFMSNMSLRLLKMELILEAYTKVEKGKPAVLNQLPQAVMDEITSIFEAPVKNELVMRFFNKWFNERVIPAFLAFKTAMSVVSPETSITDISTLKDEQIKTLLDSIVIPSSAWDVKMVFSLFIMSSASEQKNYSETIADLTKLLKLESKDKKKDVIPKEAQKESKEEPKGFFSKLYDGAKGLTTKGIEAVASGIDYTKGVAKDVYSGAGVIATGAVNVLKGKPKEIEQMVIASLQKEGINDPKTLAYIMGQLAHETGNFRYMEEIASGQAYEGRRDLGNTSPGDGRRFKGRGLIQLTGRANYTQFSKDTGIDIVSNPELAATPEIGVKTAIWYLKKRNLLAKAAAGDVVGLTKGINGGKNGLDDRILKTNSYMAMFAKGVSPQNGVVSQEPSNIFARVGDAAMGAVSSTASVVGKTASDIYTGAVDMASRGIEAAANTAKSIGSSIGGAAIEVTGALKTILAKITDELLNLGKTHFRLKDRSVTLNGMNEIFMKLFYAMLGEAKQKGLSVVQINEGVRSMQEQQRLYANYKAGRGPLAARPGTSRHGFGEAIDINTVNANQLEKSGLAAKYGFHRPLLSKGETWHIENKFVPKKGSTAPKYEPPPANAQGVIAPDATAAQLQANKPPEPTSTVSGNTIPAETKTLESVAGAPAPAGTQQTTGIVGPQEPAKKPSDVTNSLNLTASEMKADINSVFSDVKKDMSSVKPMFAELSSNVSSLNQIKVPDIAKPEGFKLAMTDMVNTAVQNGRQLDSNSSPAQYAAMLDVSKNMDATMTKQLEKLISVVDILKSIDKKFDDRLGKQPAETKQAEQTRLVVSNQNQQTTSAGKSGVDLSRNLNRKA